MTSIVHNNYSRGSRGSWLRARTHGPRGGAAADPGIDAPHARNLGTVTATCDPAQRAPGDVDVDLIGIYINKKRKGKRKRKRKHP